MRWQPKQKQKCSCVFCVLLVAGGGGGVVRGVVWQVSCTWGNEDCLRGTLLNRTCVEHKNLLIFPPFYEQYLVLFAMPPRNITGDPLLNRTCGEHKNLDISTFLLTIFVSSCLVLSCLVLCCLVFSSLLFSSLLLSCLVLSCLVLSCLVLFLFCFVVVLCCVVLSFISYLRFCFCFVLFCTMACVRWEGWRSPLFPSSTGRTTCLTAFCSVLRGTKFATFRT